MNVYIEIIGHKDQRYDTCGDWTFDSHGNLNISISKLQARSKSWKMEMLVAFHELAEVLLCKDRNISQEEVDRFDIAFEKKRKKGNNDEPGNDGEAPYFKEHQFATKLEKMLAKELKVNWNEYNKEINKL